MAVIAALNEFSLCVLLLLGVSLLKIITTRFIAHEPLNAFRFYCARLADKVNKPQNSSRQQTIAGLVAIFVTLLPIVTILWLFEAFIEVVWVWQALLLYIALGATGLDRDSKNIALALSSNQKYAAKQQLNPWVLRETDQLSSLGISKACIEAQLLRSIQQSFAVACYFIVAGPLAAITYRLLVEMHYSWNIKQPNFKNFGQYIHQLVNILQWLPTRLFTIILLLSALGQNLLLYFRLLKPHFFALNNNIAIYTLALILEVRIGGVAMYQGIKLRKESFNDHARQPEPKDIIHARTRIRYVMYFSIICLISLALALNIITFSQMN